MMFYLLVVGRGLLRQIRNVINCNYHLFQACCLVLCMLSVMRCMSTGFTDLGHSVSIAHVFCISCMLRPLCLLWAYLRRRRPFQVNWRRQLRCRKSVRFRRIRKFVYSLFRPRRMPLPLGPSLSRLHSPHPCLRFRRPSGVFGASSIARARRRRCCILHCIPPPRPFGLGPGEAFGF